MVRLMADLSRLLADAVALSHVAFLVFLAVGSVAAWRWRGLVWAHAPCVAWAFVSVTARVECPLTALEKHLRVLGGEAAYRGGFIEHYLEGVVYPAPFEPLVGTAVAVVVAAGYARLWLRLGQASTSGSS